MLELGEYLAAAMLGAVAALIIVVMCAIATDSAHETLSTCQQVLK